MIKLKKHRKIVLQFSKKMIKNLKMLLLAFWVIMIWRGVWNILDRYFMVNDFLFSNITTILIWILILLLNNFDLKELKVKWFRIKK